MWFRKALAGGLALALALGVCAPGSASKIRLKNEPDRPIAAVDAASDLPYVKGESPTTGLPVREGAFLPVLVSIDQQGGRRIGAKRWGAQAKTYAIWGAQYADIVYESAALHLKSGYATRLTFVISDALLNGQEVNVGPMRSVRPCHVTLREEWQGILAYAGGMRRVDLPEARRLDAIDNETAFDFLRRRSDWAWRVKDIKAPANINADVTAVRAMAEPGARSSARPFLFDGGSVVDSLPKATNIALDWGNKTFQSSFQYDAQSGRYLRFLGKEPALSCKTPTDGEEEQMGFENVIIQRVRYEPKDSMMPFPSMTSVGVGNADIFIEGRYVAGAWVRTGEDARTIFLDAQGKEIRLKRGKTYIAHFPVECELTLE